MKKLFSLLFITCFLSWNQSLLAVTKTWVGGTGSGGYGNWSTASNWNPSGVPTASDDVVIGGVPNFIPLLDVSPTIQSLDLTNDIHGNGDLTITGAFTWKGGIFGVRTGTLNTGTITVGGLTSLITSTTFYLTGKNLICNGGMTLSQNNFYFGIDGSATVTIPAGQTLLVSASAGVISGFNQQLNSGGTLDVLGIFQKSGPNILALGQALNCPNTTTVNVNNGTLRYLSGATHTGIFNTAAGTTLKFELGGGLITNHFNGTTFSGAGTFEFSAGIHNVNSGTTFPANTNLNLSSGGQFNDNIGLTWNNATFTNGTYTSNQNVSVAGNLSLNQGSIFGNGNWTIGGTTYWTGGNIGLTNGTNTGALTLAGLATLEGTASHIVTGKNLICNGGMTINTIGIAIDGGSTLTIPAGQNLTANTTSNFSISGTNGNLNSGGTLALAGTLIKNGAGTLTVGSVLTVNNSGTVQGNAGLINFQNCTFNNLASGNLVGSNANAFQFGTNFTNNGSISPGSSIGTLGITRTTLPVKILNIEIAQAAPPQKDLLNITGNADFSGGSTLNVTETQCLDDGSYTIITWTGTRTGAFSTLNLPAGYTVAYDDAQKKVNLVYDDPAPIIICPANVTANNDPGFCSKNNPALGSPTAVDNCPGVSTSNNGVAPYPVGTTIVTWTATDSKGQTAVCAQVVQILDNENPTISCPATVFQNADAGECFATLTISAATFSDNCSATTSNNAPANFPVGTTVVLHTATDASGNTATCNQNVVVLDNQNPTISCPAAISQNADAGECFATLSVAAATFSDNCSATTSNNAPATFPVGTTVVLHTATDASGNTATCNQNVVVLDNQNPTISCPAAISQNANAGQCFATLTIAAATFSDNCSATTSNNAPANFPVGTTVVLHTATDASGNTATCNQNVVVLDNQNPTITCPANIPNANCSGAVSLGTASATDNCAPPTLTNNAPTTFAGTIIVTYTATDASGNTATCQQTVTCSAGCTLAVTFTEKKPTCWNSTNGTLQADPPAPVSAYTYLWNTGATTRKIINIGAGFFTVSVTHTLTGCVTVHTRTIIAPAPPSLTLAVKNSCFGQSNGSITATPTTGRTFLWSNAATTSSLTGLSSGTFSVTTTVNTSGCTNTASAVIFENPELILSHSVQLLSNGKYKITLAASGGTPPYKYCRLNTTTGACSFNSTVIYSNLLAGTTWTFRTKDFVGCIVEIVVTLPSSKPAKSRSEQVFEQPTVNIFPNPTENWLHLSTDLQGEKTVSIFNSTGKLVFRQANFLGEADFQTENFQPGVYQILIENERGERLVERFLKI